MQMLFNLICIYYISNGFNYNDTYSINKDLNFSH